MFLCPSSGIVPPFFSTLATRMEEHLMSFKALCYCENTPLPEWLSSSPEIQRRLQAITQGVLRHGLCWQEVHRQCGECSEWISATLYPLNDLEAQGMTQFLYGMVAQQCAAAQPATL